ncbi:MAG: hypothetical protein ACR652_10465 [Methylocystis sp.]|uniref:hypothetical protein n=1 Tax=Methylocystis sp. TaxID=1911079 RepID=UPI003DA55FC9
MKLVRSGRFALFALAGLAVAASGPAQAADDKSTISAVAELFGYSSDPSAGSIDYHERPKLVLPPRAGELPAPRDASRPEGWPSDTTTTRKRGSDRYARVPNAPPPTEEHKPGLFDRLTGGGGAPAAATPATVEPGRRMLTEPPTGYRRPTMDLSKVPDSDVKKSSWWNPLSYLGSKDDSDPAQSAAAGTSGKPAAGSGNQAQSSSSSSWFQMPRFVRRTSED